MQTATSESRGGPDPRNRGIWIRHPARRRLEHVGTHQHFHRPISTANECSFRCVSSDKTKQGMTERDECARSLRLPALGNVSWIRSDVFGRWSSLASACDRLDAVAPPNLRCSLWGGRKHSSFFLIDMMLNELEKHILSFRVG